MNETQNTKQESEVNNMTKLEALHYIGAKGFTKRTATNIYREALSQCEVAKADIDAVINARLAITTVENDETENN